MRDNFRADLAIVDDDGNSRLHCFSSRLLSARRKVDDCAPERHAQLGSQQTGRIVHPEETSRARARVLARIRRAELGNLGDTKSVGHGVQEMRIDAGPGYRVYFVTRGKDVIMLLAGGDKSSQAADIKRAQVMARNL